MTRRGDRPGRRRVVLRAVVAAGLLLVSAVVIAVPVYYFPVDDPVELDRVDAVFVLGPPRQGRIDVAEDYARAAGGAPVYVSVWAGVVCGPEYRCVHADPWTTNGEAEALRTIMERDGVRHPLVVTGRTHVARARYIFHRCVSDAVPVVGVAEDLGLLVTVYEPIYQTAAFVKALVTPCS